VASTLQDTLPTLETYESWEGCGMRDPSGIRTRVTAVRGRRTRPLYDGADYATSRVCQQNTPHANLVTTALHENLEGGGFDSHAKRQRSDRLTIGVGDNAF
jgi:hypothetical protein